MKKLMLIGKTGSGKTTLAQVLREEQIHLDKTQTIEYGDFIIDTPGEYIENRRFYQAIIVTAAECHVVAFVQDCKSEDNVFPPGFASVFTKPVIGIITKTDLCNRNKKRAEEILNQAGACIVFETSAYKKEGINELMKYIK